MGPHLPNEVQMLDRLKTNAEFDKMHVDNVVKVYKHIKQHNKHKDLDSLKRIYKDHYHKILDWLVGNSDLRIIR